MKRYFRRKKENQTRRKGVNRVRILTQDQKTREIDKPSKR